MAKAIKNENKKEAIKPVITHIMADGSIRDSVEGYFCTVNEYTETAYRLFAKWAIEKQQ
jgi:hypothetical protein